MTSRAAGGSPGGAFSFSSGAPTPHAAMMAETWSVSWPAAAFHHEIYFLLFPSSIGPTSPFVRSFKPEKFVNLKFKSNFKLPDFFFGFNLIIFF